MNLEPYDDSQELGASMFKRLLARRRRKLAARGRLLRHMRDKQLVRAADKAERRLMRGRPVPPRYGRAGPFVPPRMTTMPVRRRPRVQRFQPGQQGFFQWLRGEHPGIYRNIAMRAPALMRRQVRMAYGSDVSADMHAGALDYEGYNYDTGDYQLWGIGQAATPATPPKTWADRVMDFASPLLQAYQQKQIFKAQLKRAERNLPPLKTEEMATQVKVQVEPGKELMQGLTKFAVPVGIGVAALFVLPRLLRG